jgi:hypothetical protein
MMLPHSTTVWSIRQGVRLAWALASAAEQLGITGERLENRQEAVALARGVDIRTVLEPLTASLSAS